MLRSDFSRKTHANLQNCFLYAKCFSSTLTSNDVNFMYIEVHIESNFHFSVSVDFINHFNATNITIRLFRCVNNPHHI